MEAGLDNVWLHDLRHYVAPELIAQGVDGRTVAGRLGHRNASTTLNVYAQFVPEADQAAAELLGRGFAKLLREGSGVGDSDLPEGKSR